MPDGKLHCYFVHISGQYEVDGVRNAKGLVTPRRVAFMAVEVNPKILTAQREA